VAVDEGDPFEQSARLRQSLVLSHFRHAP